MARARPEHIIEHVTRVRSISVSCFVYDVQIIFCLFHGTFKDITVICIFTDHFLDIKCDPKFHMTIVSLTEIINFSKWF